MASNNKGSRSSKPVVMNTTTHASYFSNKIQSLAFAPLNSDGSNYLEWINDAKVVLSADELQYTIEHEGEEEITQIYKSQAMLVLRRHLDHSLKLQYITVTDPQKLWSMLEARFNQQQTLFFPQARSEWINLRVLDFLDFATFNSELHRISTQLRLCGEPLTKPELLEKTLSIFPPATAILAQQYCNMKFTKHSKLMSHILFAKKTSTTVAQECKEPTSLGSACHNSGTYGGSRHNCNNPARSSCHRGVKETTSGLHQTANFKTVKVRGQGDAPQA